MKHLKKKLLIASVVRRQKLILRLKMFSFAISANMFVAFDDDLLRDKLELFLRKVSFRYHIFKRTFFALAALSFCTHVFKDLRIPLLLFERLALTLFTAHIRP